MTGGAGNDTYVVDNDADRVYEFADGGIDRVESAVTYTLGTDVENLTLTGADAINGTGNTANNAIRGNDAANILEGGDGNDLIDGGSGPNTLNGGVGDDTFILNGLDTVDGGAGTDTVYASPGFYDTTFANVEVLAFTSDYSAVRMSVSQLAAFRAIESDVENFQFTFDGNGGVANMTARLGAHSIIVDALGLTAGMDLSLGGGNDSVDGSTHADVIRAGGGNDTIRGQFGDDTIYGEAGDDTITAVGNGIVKLFGGAGDDSLSVAFQSGVGRLYGGDGTDSLEGGNGADFLDGGTGADALAGSYGNDSYIVDSAGDTVKEDDASALGGIDRVFASVSHTLSANVESLSQTGLNAIEGTGNDAANAIGGNAAANTLRGLGGDDVLYGFGGADKLYGGAGIDMLFGGDGDDSLIGEAGNDKLDGGAGNDRLDGGLGADRLAGGDGNDSYVVDNVLDVVIETNALADTGGIDRVFSSVNWRLAANVENLTLTGTSSTNGTGNTLANAISGNAAANIIDGGGGNDVLAGGAGRDTFAFSSALDGAANRDFIADFNAADDTISLENTGAGLFKALAAGNLATGAFHAAAGASRGHDADDRIVYNTTTGALYYDADGSGAAAAIQFATLRGHPAISAADFVVV